MMLHDFNDLLTAAANQQQPQRLLFVFARAGLPDAPTPQQHQRHREGQGGTLAPVLCVDKAPDEVPSFASLTRESERTGQQWDVMFVAALDGRAGVAPSSDEAAQPLRLMVNAINDGQVSRFAAFDPQGQPIQFY